MTVALGICDRCHDADELCRCPPDEVTRETWAGPGHLEVPGGAEPICSRLGTALTRPELATLPKVSHLVSGVLSHPCAAVLVGGYGLGKTVLVHALGCCVATGQKWLGHAVAQQRVLFIVGEGAYGLDERITAWEQETNDGKPVGGDQATFLVKPASLKNASTWDEITVYAVDGKYGFVILDTFSSLAPDADETKDSAQIMRRVSDLSGAIRGTVLLVHHPGWSDAGRTRGGYQFEANADEVLVMTASAEGSSLVRLARKKVKDSPSGGSVWLNRRAAHGSVVFASARPDDADVPLRSRVLTVLANYGPLGATGPQILKEMRVPDEAVSGFYKAMRKLVASGEVRAEGPRNRTRYYMAPVQGSLEEIKAESW